jgi:hypothetical protein
MRRVTGEILQIMAQRSRPVVQATIATEESATHEADMNNPHQTTADQVGAAKGDHGATLPTASESLRGQIYTVEGGTSVADGEYVCLKLADGTYGWAPLASEGLSVEAHAAIDHTSITGCGGTGGVTSLKVTGQASGLTGDVGLAAGSGVTLEQNAETGEITISATGGGSSFETMESYTLSGINLGMTESSAVVV